METYSKEETERIIAENKRRIEYLKAYREAKLEAERQRRKKRIVFDTLFPEFKDVPIIWVVIGILCVLFSLFSMVII